MTEPGRHPFDHLARDQHRRDLARDHRGGDDDVALGHDPPEQLALAIVKRFILGTRVAARVLGILGLEGQLDEARPEALDLFLGGRPQVVRRGDGAEPPRRGDRLEPGHARPDHQHPRRRDRARRRRQHREHAGQGIGGDDDGLVTADRRHRGKRVHALRAGRPRHQLDRERRDPRLGDRPDGLDRSQRPRKPISTWSRRSRGRSSLPVRSFEP